MEHDGNLEGESPATPRDRYDAAIQALHNDFEANRHRLIAGSFAVRARATAVDRLVRELWPAEPPGAGVAVVAVGGYGRRELFPHSDVDLMILLDDGVLESRVSEAIRLLNQQLWDAGLRVSPMTRTLAECGQFEPENVEFTLALLDARHVAGSAELTGRLVDSVVPRMLERHRKAAIARLLEVTSTRHGRYGDTPFHLEPNVKECPGGLRDAHVCAWLALLGGRQMQAAPAEFVEAREFLLEVRTFLHLRHGRDDNTLDWRAQDEAAARQLGAAGGSSDPAFWMRQYFRHARAIERRLAQTGEEFTSSPLDSVTHTLSGIRRAHPGILASGFEVRQGRILFAAPAQSGSAQPQRDAAHDPETVFAIFATMARTGARLPQASETRLEAGLPVLSAQLEDGPGLWLALQAILTGPFAGHALRAMHALGILELIIPEFHGIDALVIRDAYHRYTVDEHTFVVIDTLHALGAERSGRDGWRDNWRSRFAQVLRDLPHPELLLLAALLHDTGKGHLAERHAAESARMATNVLARLEIDSYESGLVLGIIGNHLEMGAALRRDVFDPETIRTFAKCVQTPEALRMLTLFTYADITAVHPDALTPWKAENLWRLYTATSNYLDRSVDEQRVAALAVSEQHDVLLRVHALLPGREQDVTRFLEGFPRRYVLTRTPEHIRTHVELAGRLEHADADRDQLDFRYGRGLSELTLVTRDRPKLFATMAGILAAWQMNIVTADAFSNAQGIVVDSFRFTDTFRTLELNESERARFVESARDAMSGRTDLEEMLAARRRGRGAVPKIAVETRVYFDDTASTQSTLLQVIAQDTPGLLRALSLTLAEHGCNIDVALVDTEGEMAIDVFYLTILGAKLDDARQAALSTALEAAIVANAA
jgi:[protein-PII] uridylyltransferase